MRAPATPPSPPDPPTARSQPVAAGPAPAPAPAEDLDATAQLAEAVETLRAIRNGEVDALVVADGSPGEQVFTLSSADRPYRMFVESMRDGAATTSSSGTILYANRCLSQMLRVPLELIIGTALEALVVEADRAALAEQIAQAGSDGTVEIALIGPDLRPVPVRVGISILTEEFQPLVCLTFADLTEPRRLQQELADAYAQAVEASRLKSQFVANMSHEVRTPLYGVLGMTNLLLSTALTAEQREYAAGVQASGDVLMKVINEILDFSKIEAGKLELEESSYAVADLVEAACAVAAMAAHSKQVELLWSVAPDVPPNLSGDPTRISQVLGNLLSNAVKFTAAGEVAVDVGWEQHGARETVRFTVRDTGIGIEPDAAQRIFESFSQADASTTRRYGGTGLGLTISKRLVTLMDGDIGVDSVRGEGSAFWFSVAARRSVEPVPSSAVPDLAGVHVLVVDDNATSRAQLAGHVSDWGGTCDTAADARAALEGLRGVERPYDLVIVDAVMPTVDGSALVRRIRAEHPAAFLPIVMLVSSQAGRDAEAFAGVNGFATKPVRAVRLGAELTRVLGRDTPSSVPAGALAQETGAGQSLIDPGGPARVVLLAEDNTLNQLVTSRLLEKRGFRVEIADDGRAAIEMSSRREYAAIFMDCHMPEVDGFEATAEIRRRAVFPHVPIIAMTANTMVGDRDRCLAAGMDDYIGKPVDPEALDEAISRWLRTAATPREAAGRR